MNEKEYFEKSQEKNLPSRCPILDYCMRRAYSLYFFGEFKGGENQNILKILQRHNLLKNDFEEKAIELSGEVPEILFLDDYKTYENQCPEVNLFDTTYAFRFAIGKASTSGVWNSDSLGNNKFKNLKSRHYSECSEFSKTQFEKPFVKRKMTPKRKNPTYRQKVRLLQESKNQCAFCDFSDAGRIQFHHIDENPANTILENLISVCPNCHSLIGEKAITEKEVLNKKQHLKSNFKSEKNKENTNIKISKSTLNNPVVGNNNIININVKKQAEKKIIQKYPDGSIGQNVLMYGYSKYLADKYADYKTFELKNKGQKFNYASFYGKVKKDFKAGGFFHIPETRFLDLTTYLQSRIDRTILAKVNKSKGILKNYTSYPEYELENIQKK